MNTNAITPGQKRKISDLLKQKGVTKKDLQKLLETGLLAKLLESIANVNEPEVLKRLPAYLETLMKAARFDSLPWEHSFGELIGVHPVQLCMFGDFVVNHNKSFLQLMSENMFDGDHQDVTEERFPLRGEGIQRLTAFLVPVNNTQSIARAIKGLDERGMRPGNTAELLTLPGHLKPLIEARRVHLYPKTSISVVALDTKDPVGTPNGNRKVLTWRYTWRDGAKSSTLSTEGNPYVGDGKYLLAFSK